MLLARPEGRTTLRSRCCGSLPRNSLLLFVFLALPTAAQNLRLAVTEGDGLEVSAGSRSFAGVSVQVTDDMGSPIPAARVTFRLPENGPSGLFPNGKRTEEQATDAQGKASAWGIQWNAQPGNCHVSITAHHQGATAGTTARIRITQAARENAPAASFEVDINKTPRPAPPPPPEDQTGAAAAPSPISPAPPEPGKRPGVLWTRTEQGEDRISGGRAKWVVITLGVAGALGGFAAYRLNGKTPVPATAASVVTGPVLTLSVPAITIGKP